MIMSQCDYQTIPHKNSFTFKTSWEQATNGALLKENIESLKDESSSQMLDFSFNSLLLNVE